MFVYILGAVFLMGLLIMLVKGSTQEGTGIDSEQTALKVNEVVRYAAELERGVAFVQQNGQSESDIRFAHEKADPAYGDITDTPARQIFAPEGGAVEYKLPPAGVNDGTPWQFYATTHIYHMGTDTAALQKSELMAVLPNMGEAACRQINQSAGQTGIDLADIQDPGTNGCVYAGAGNEFTGSFVDDASANTIDSAKFTKIPPREACIRCQGGNLHYYRVLLAR